MSRCLCHNSTLSLLSTNQAVCATMCQNSTLCLLSTNQAVWATMCQKSTLCLLFNKSFVCVTMFMAQHHSMSDVQQIICMSQCLWHNSTLHLMSNKPSICPCDFVPQQHSMSAVQQNQAFAYITLCHNSILCLSPQTFQNKIKSIISPQTL